MNLKHLLKQPLQVVPNKVAIILLIVALIGFADAGYLTVEHYKDAIPPCSITGGCESVLTSGYATIAGLPVSLIGAVYYLLIAVGIFTYIESKKTRLLKLALLLVVLGFIATLWFVYLQLFVIKAICLYCMGSALTTTLLFIGAVYVFHLQKFNGPRENFVSSEISS
jgi:uncharacterized membrane protein